MTKEIFIADLATLLPKHPAYEAEIKGILRLVLGVSDVAISRPTAFEMRLFRTEGKISSIKAFRNRTGMALKESKDAVEAEGIALGIEPFGQTS